MYCNQVPGIFQARILEIQFLLQGIFLTQGLNPCLLQVSYIAGGFFTAEALGMPKEGEGWTKESMKRESTTESTTSHNRNMLNSLSEWIKNLIIYPFDDFFKGDSRYWWFKMWRAYQANADKEMASVILFRRQDGERMALYNSERYNLWQRYEVYTHTHTHTHTEYITSKFTK